MKKKYTIAITGMNALPENPGPGISVAKCLHKAFPGKVRIIGLGYDAFDAGLYLENICDSSYLIPFPKYGAKALLLRLQEIQKKEKIDVFIPCLEVELLGLISIEDQLRAIGIHTFIPTKEQLLLCTKDKLDVLAKIGKINYPEIKLITSPDFFNTCTFSGWNYPLVVKGYFCEAVIAFTPDEAKAAFYTIVSHWGYPILVQRYVYGEESNLTAIGDGKGNMIGEVTMKKIALTSKNKGLVCVSTLDKALVNAARLMIKELKWKGPFEVEGMYDHEKKYHLLEINPRFPQWISLSEKAGCNLPARLLEMTLNLKLTPLSTPIVGSVLIRYASEQLTFLNQIEKLITYGASDPP